MQRPAPFHRRATGLAVACIAVVVAAMLAGCRTPSDAPPESWGDIHSGIPRERLHKRLGQPSGKSARGGDSWTANGWVLDVEYDQEGNVDGSSQGHAPSRRPTGTEARATSTPPQVK
ncbi:MAG: hypothetical protein ACKOEQ_10540 [Verrucomicrobiota bacterium]